MSNINRTRRLILISLLSAISFVLMFIKFPLPFLPSYLTIDFSDLPALIGLFTVGPVGAVLIEAIKNLLNFVFNPAEPVGPAANFLAGTALILTVYFIAGQKESRRLIPALAAGVIVMTIVMSVLNYFVLLPIYGMIMNFSDISKNLKVIITAGIIPFNLIKGLIVSVVFLLLSRPLLPVIKKNLL